MGQTIGNVLPLALGVGISPIPIVAVVLMLATPRGRVNGPAFLLGWIVGIAAVGTAVLVIAGVIKPMISSRRRPCGALAPRYGRSVSHHFKLEVAVALAAREACR